MTLKYRPVYMKKCPHCPYGVVPLSDADGNFLRYECMGCGEVYMAVDGFEDVCAGMVGMPEESK